MKKLKIISGAPERIIMGINERDNYSSKILKVLDITYSHGTKIFRILAKNKIITTKKLGCKMYIELTKKGIGIQHHLKEIRGLL